MEVSGQDIKAKIEKTLSDILSRKYDAKITVKFEKEKRNNGNSNQSRTIGEK